MYEKLFVLAVIVGLCWMILWIFSDDHKRRADKQKTMPRGEGDLYRRRGWYAGKSGPCLQYEDGRRRAVVQIYGLIFPGNWGYTIWHGEVCEGGMSHEDWQEIDACVEAELALSWMADAKKGG